MKKQISEFNLKYRTRCKLCWIFREDGFEIAYFNKCIRCKESYFGKYPSGEICINCHQSSCIKRIIKSYPWESEEQKKNFKDNLRMLWVIEDNPGKPDLYNLENDLPYTYGFQ